MFLVLQIAKFFKTMFGNLINLLDFYHSMVLFIGKNSYIIQMQKVNPFLLNIRFGVNEVLFSKCQKFVYFVKKKNS